MTCKKCGENKQRKAASYVQRALALLKEAETDGKGNAAALLRLQEAAQALPDVPIGMRGGVAEVSVGVRDRRSEVVAHIENNNEALSAAVLEAAQNGEDVIAAFRRALIKAPQKTPQ